jgi:hypothetical protein
MGSRDTVPLILNGGISWRWVESFSLRPPRRPRIAPGTHCVRDWMVAKADFDKTCLCKELKSYPSAHPQSLYWVVYLHLIIIIILLAETEEKIHNKYKKLVNAICSYYELLKPYQSHCNGHNTTTVNNFVNCGFVAPYYKIHNTYTYPHPPSK